MGREEILCMCERDAADGLGAGTGMSLGVYRGSTDVPLAVTCCRKFFAEAEIALYHANIEFFAAAYRKAAQK